jgi:catecholate siderophore receptor
MSDRFSLVSLFLTILFPVIVLAQEPLHIFHVRSGSLKDAVSSYEHATGLKVEILDGLNLADFRSPGLAGEFDARTALVKLVEGTGLSVSAIPGGFLLRIAAAPVRVQVDGQTRTYRAIDATTATKTATPLRDIPQSIAVVPIELLRDQRAQSVGDAMRNVVGVTVAQGEGNRDQLVMRGTSTNSDFFVNGIRDDQERFRDLYNVDAIEVVQGPAAVLFGRGGAGGVINLVTNRPVRGMRPEVGVELGAYGHKRGLVQFGLPVGTSGAFRLSAVGQDSGGFRDGYYLQRYGLNPTFSMSLGSKTTLLLGAEYFHDERLADRGIPSQAGAPVDVTTSQLFGSRTQNRATGGVKTARATIEHRVSPSLLIRSNFLAGGYDKFYGNVYPGSAVSTTGTLSLSAYDHSVDRLNLFNQTDLVYDASLFGLSHTILAGVEAGRQSQDELRHTAAAIPNVLITASERDANFAAAPLTVDRHANGAVLAGYAQDQITINQFMKAVVGARLDRFSVAVDDHIAGAPDLTRTDVEVSPRAGVVVQPTQTTSIYASYSYAFLPSGQTLGLARNTADVAPENAKNYETGVKLDLLDRRLAITGALFRLDRNNVKNTDPTDPTRLVLTGQQRTDGVQLAAAGHVWRGLNFTAGYASLTARVTRETTAAPAGRTVGLVPRHQANLWATYGFGARCGLGGGVVHQSRMFTSFTNTVTLPAFTRADAYAYYRLGRYRLALNVDNVFDAKYYPTANGDNNISPGTPRSLSVSLRASF